MSEKGITIAFSSALGIISRGAGFMQHRYPNFYTRGGISFSLAIVFVLLGGILLSAFLTPDLTGWNERGTSAGVVVTPMQENDKDNLQLRTFGVITVTPQPTLSGTAKRSPVDTGPGDGTICRNHAPRTGDCSCVEYAKVWAYCALDATYQNAECAADGGGVQNLPGADDPNKLYCVWEENAAQYAQRMQDPNCISACIYKPVIYLYPTSPTFVDVTVTAPGRVFLSDPFYPAGGWKNVLAYPDGALRYQGRQYTELFYETDVDIVNAPENGIVLKTVELQERLLEITTQYGLIGPEQEAFVTFWVAKLQELDAPYILFSVITGDEKERIDHVTITPQPDVFIEFLAYFKPLDTPFYDGEILLLPQDPPKRHGFTAVEWGGTIDQD